MNAVWCKSGMTKIVVELRILGYGTHTRIIHAPRPRNLPVHARLKHLKVIQQSVTFEVQTLYFGNSKFRIQEFRRQRVKAAGSMTEYCCQKEKVGIGALSLLAVLCDLYQEVLHKFLETVMFRCGYHPKTTLAVTNGYLKISHGWNPPHQREGAAVIVRFLGNCSEMGETQPIWLRP